MVEALSKLWKKKKATADLESMRRIFSAPESKTSTLSLIEKEISQNIQGFLSQHIVSEDSAPADLEQDFLETEIPEDPIFVSEQAEFLLTKVVAQSVHTSSPSFIGHMTSALPYFMLPLAKIMMALNQNLVKIETSKAFTPLERQVIGMLHRLVYERDEAFYKLLTQDRHDSLGVFCSGGTIANMTGLWVARNRLLGPQADFPGIGECGLIEAMRYYGYQGLAVFVSKRGHYSLSKATDLLGIGKNQLIAIDTDAHNKISIKALRQALDASRKKGVAPVAIVGVAGTTETGNVDPLESLADVAAEYRCHFHVDAAWGGPTLFSDQHRHLLQGIERADSVCIDAHKQMYVPVGAGIILFREQKALNAIEQHANYVIREGSRDLGKHTLEGSRPGMAMLVHSGLRVMGRKGYELLINQGIERAKAFASLIEQSDDFELISAPELNLLTYRFVPKAMREKLQHGDPAQIAQLNQMLNELTVTIQKEQRAAGKTFVSRTKLEPHRYAQQAIDVFRVVLANPLTDEQILRNVLEEQRQIAHRLVENNFFANLAQRWQESPTLRR